MHACVCVCVCVFMQPCLGGNSRTIIIAAINPAHTHIDETANTLLFAQRAMNLVNTVTANVTAADGAAGGGAAGEAGGAAGAVADLRAQVTTLQGKLREAEAQLKGAQTGKDSPPLTDSQRAALAMALEVGALSLAWCRARACKHKLFHAMSGRACCSGDGIRSTKTCPLSHGLHTRLATHSWLTHSFVSVERGA